MVPGEIQRTPSSTTILSSNKKGPPKRSGPSRSSIVCLPKHMARRAVLVCRKMATLSRKIHNPPASKCLAPPLWEAILIKELSFSPENLFPAAATILSAMPCPSSGW